MLSRLEVGMLQKVIEERQSGKDYVDLLTLSLVSLISNSRHSDGYRFPATTEEFVECFRDSIMPNGSWPEVLRVLGNKNPRWRSLAEKWMSTESEYRNACTCNLKLEHFITKTAAPLLLEINGVNLPVDQLEQLSSDDHLPTFLIEEQVKSIILRSGLEPSEFLIGLKECERNITSEHVISAIAKVSTQLFIAARIAAYKINIRPSMPRQCAMLLTEILSTCLGRHKVIDEVFIGTFGLEYLNNMGFDELVCNTVRNVALGKGVLQSGSDLGTDNALRIDFDTTNAYSRLATIREHFTRSFYVTRLIHGDMKSFLHKS
ncbi:hypothetical protein VCHA53O466_50264 [Vibrio chagasii]|nr:hypothetical protein VCHA53O466_50264 [Vibrio chagasii]